MYPFTMPCGQTPDALSLRRRTGELDPDRLQNHVLTCPACRAFLNVLDASTLGPALAIGFRELEHEQARKQEAHEEARRRKGWPAKVRRLRRSLGVTQQDLADRLGVTRATVQRWETGRCHPLPLACKAVEEEIHHLNQAILNA